MVVFAMEADGVHRRLDEVLAVLAAAYGASPDALRPMLCENLGTPGFRLVALQQRDGQMMGVAYGHDLLPTDLLYTVASGRMKEPHRHLWLDDAFQVVELAVVPSERRRGLGVRLLNGLLGGVPHRTALLAVWGGSVARKLCERHGWHVVVPDLTFHQGGSPCVLMGRDNDPPEGEEWED